MKFLQNSSGHSGGHIVSFIYLLTTSLYGIGITMACQTNKYLGTYIKIVYSHKNYAQNLMRVGQYRQLE